MAQQLAPQHHPLLHRGSAATGALAAEIVRTNRPAASSSYRGFFSGGGRHTGLTCGWSSDVCSSDLILFLSNPFERLIPVPPDGNDLNPLLQEIGRASCRERVEISGGAVSLKKT